MRESKFAGEQMIRMMGLSECDAFGLGCENDMSHPEQERDLLELLLSLKTIALLDRLSSLFPEIHGTHRPDSNIETKKIPSKNDIRLQGATLGPGSNRTQSN